MKMSDYRQGAIRHLAPPHASAPSFCAGLPTAASLPLLVMMLAHSPSVDAQSSDDVYTTFRNPPVFRAQDDLESDGQQPGQILPSPGGASTQSVLRPPSRQQQARIRLDVAYLRNHIWNPHTGRAEAVRLRGYYHQDKTIVGPTIETYPGEQLRIRLNNRLPPDPDCPDGEQHADHGDHNRPKCFNTTNLHTHGLWVDPNGDSDNVFLKVSPGKDQLYRINIPWDHPAGTFWYHSHVHGSTALQVSNGQAGALIIRGKRQPSSYQSGDLDTLLTSTDRYPVFERILMFQQIQYACRNEEGKIKKNPDNTWRCDEGDVGELESYDALGLGQWPASGRLTTINGTSVPTFRATAGELERWRMIHGGVRETISLEFRRIQNISHENGLNQEVHRMSAKDMQSFIRESCTGESLQQHLVAADGLTMNSIQSTRETVFQPGYRWDSLMVFPKAGYYCVIDKTTPPNGSVDNVSASQLLGIVEVLPGSTEVDENDITAYLKQRLIDMARVNVRSNMRQAVIGDLQGSMGLSHYAPHSSLEHQQMTGPGQTVVFNISIDEQTGEPRFEVNGKPYDGKSVRLLKLGDTEEWLLKSDRFGHPFHIHVNPFQIISIQDRHGRELSGFDTPDDDNGRMPVDTQFRGLKNVWKDTLFIKSAPGDDLSQGQYRIRIRTQYRRFTGKFVLHCHILDHEDGGMMENVQIVGPGKPRTPPPSPWPPGRRVTPGPELPNPNI